MNHYLQFIFIFYMGCTLGWFLELFYRRLAHGKWINPGFLIGPYLPIYGFGLVILTFVYLYDSFLSILITYLDICSIYIFFILFVFL